MEYHRLAKIFDERYLVNSSDYLKTCKEVKAILEERGAEVEVDQIDDQARLRIFTSDEEWLVRISAQGYEISQISNMIL